MRAKYRILQVNDHFIVKKRISWFWIAVTHRYKFNEVRKFQSEEDAEEYIRRACIEFKPIISTIAEYGKDGMKL